MKKNTKESPKRNVGGLVKFKKGERPVGRAKGTKNKFTVKLKEAIIEAAELSGQNGKGKGGAVGYLVWLSRAEPAVFGRMLEKLLPMQLDVKDKTFQQPLTPEEAVAKLRDRGLPVPPSLLELSEQVGRAVAMQQENDDDDALDGPVEEEQEEEMT